MVTAARLPSIITHPPPTTQYKEHSRTHTHKENGKEIKETEYWYTEEWSDKEIWSSSFDDPSYRNPRVRACRHTTTKLRDAYASPQYCTCHASSSR